jgi:dTDP-glucose pyrophosphorylase
MAGEGSRLLPVTKGLRKEMLPLFYQGKGGVPVLAPVAHLVVNSLHAAGVDNITMVVGNDAANLLRYFTPDGALLDRHAHHQDRLVETLALYDLLSRVHFSWVIQSSPAGFGDALLRSSAAVGDHPFLLHAADAILMERQAGRALSAMKSFLSEKKAGAVLFVRKVRDPRRYGVVEGVAAGRWEGYRTLRVTGMEEKPTAPRSSWAATAMYAFTPEIFDILREIHGRDPTRELEVTSGIEGLIARGRPVFALVSRPAEERWLSVGSPEGYFRALHYSYRAATRKPGPPK